jgi:hypothetical protein
VAEPWLPRHDADSLQEFLAGGLSLGFLSLHCDWLNRKRATVGR